MMMATWVNKHCCRNDSVMLDGHVENFFVLAEFFSDL